MKKKGLIVGLLIVLLVLGSTPIVIQPLIAHVSAAIRNQSDYRILVNEDGIYQLTYTGLQAAGVPVDSLDPRTFRLHNQGGEVAIYVVGESDGSFDAVDCVLFYGQKMTTKFTDVNVYWLSWGGANGLRMATVNGSPGGTGTVPTSFKTTRRVEEDNLYRSAHPSGPDDDHWYWDIVYGSSPTVVDYSVTFEHLSTEPISATVRGLFRGYAASPQHHTRVYINALDNDHLIDDAYWGSQKEYAFEVDVPQAYLVEGGNTIFVELPMDGGITSDIFFVNRFEIDYHRTYAAEGGVLFFDGEEAGTWEYHLSGFMTDTLETFDITTPNNPTRILDGDIGTDGSSYTLTFEHTISGEHHYVTLSSTQRLSPLSIERDTPSNLHATSNGADYLLITHADFSAAVQPLATHRAAQGLRTFVIDVQDLYDEFSYGVFDPEAIRGFLAYAYANWTAPAPTYVLLVGDGNYDFQDNLGYGEPNYIPPYLADVDPWMGEVAADNRYVCVSGDDIFPDMHLGRLPVKTAGEAEEMVAKILNYEQNPPGGDWNQKLLFVTDNPDEAGNFYDLSDNIINNYLPTLYTPDKVYYGLTHSTPASAKLAIINAINQGRLLVNYFGHSTINFWAYERLFEVDDIASLSNGGRQPVMGPMTALDGYFIQPSPAGMDRSSLGESIVRAAEGGAIASWSPTGVGVATGHYFLNRGLYEAIFFDGILKLGPATTRAKLHLYQEAGGAYRELIDTYVLFGDPAQELCSPDDDNDGVLDELDNCPTSELSVTVIIDDCDSGAPNTLLPTGCTISDRIALCAARARNHGQFVRCVTHLTKRLKRTRVITRKHKGSIRRCAAKADIP